MYVYKYWSTTHSRMMSRAALTTLYHDITITAQRRNSRTTSSHAVTNTILIRPLKSQFIFASFEVLRLVVSFHLKGAYTVFRGRRAPFLMWNPHTDRLYRPNRARAISPRAAARSGSVAIGRILGVSGCHAMCESTAVWTQNKCTKYKFSKWCHLQTFGARLLSAGEIW